jgi:hypothetical protein
MQLNKTVRIPAKIFQDLVKEFLQPDSGFFFVFLVGILPEKFCPVPDPNIACRLGIYYLSLAFWKKP